MDNLYSVSPVLMLGQTPGIVERVTDLKSRGEEV